MWISRETAREKARWGVVPWDELCGRCGSGAGRDGSTTGFWHFLIVAGSNSLGGLFLGCFGDLKLFLQPSQQFWELSKLLNESLSAWVSGFCYLSLRTLTMASSTNVSYYQAHGLWLHLFAHEPTVPVLRFLATMIKLYLTHKLTSE